MCPDASARSNTLRPKASKTDHRDWAELIILTTLLAQPQTWNAPEIRRPGNVKVSTDAQ